MKVVMKRLALLTAILGAAGCTSTPAPRYYTLDMTPSTQHERPCNIVVDRLRPAESLVRTDILIHKTPTQVEYYALDRWAASLGELIAHKLNAEFGPIDEQHKTILLTGEILAFEQVDVPGGAQAHIQIQLEAREEGASRHEKPLCVRMYHKTLPAKSPAPEAVVQALSEGLEQIAAEICEGAAAWSRKAGPE
jgi:uncharacterized lipoprotein YmbA